LDCMTVRARPNACQNCSRLETKDGQLVLFSSLSFRTTAGRLLTKCLHCSSILGRSAAFGHFPRERRESGERMRMRMSESWGWGASLKSNPGSKVRNVEDSIAVIGRPGSKLRGDPIPFGKKKWPPHPFGKTNLT
jgi:hypothetical protein